jgi:hypothetical protein
MQELQPTWRHAISVWWLNWWRGLIGSVALLPVVEPYRGDLFQKKHLWWAGEAAKRAPDVLSVQVHLPLFSSR